MQGLENKKIVMKEKNIILTARIMSMLFTPFYLPLVGLVALFLFSYMSLLPLAYKLPMLLTVYLFTILLPSVLIHIYRRYQGWSTTELGKKERRIVAGGEPAGLPHTGLPGPVGPQPEKHALAPLPGGGDRGIWGLCPHHRRPHHLPGAELLSPAHRRHLCLQLGVYFP